MPYFSYHGRNKKLIKGGYLKDYYFDETDNKRFLVLVFNDGRQFPIKEERWIEYYSLIDSYFNKEE